MKLTEYLSRNGETRAEFAARMGVTAEAVRLWENGNRTPRKAQMQKISEVTKGKVRPQDFFEVFAKSPVLGKVS